MPAQVLVVANESEIPAALSCVRENPTLFPLPVCRQPWWSASLATLIEEFELFELGLDGVIEAPVSPVERTPVNDPPQHVLHCLLASDCPTAQEVASRYCEIRNRRLAVVESLDELASLIGRSENGSLEATEPRASAIRDIVFWGLTADYPLALIDDLDDILAEYENRIGKRPSASYMVADSAASLLYLAFKSLLAFSLPRPVQRRDAYFDALTSEPELYESVNAATTVIRPKHAAARLKQRHGCVVCRAHGRPYELAAYTDEGKAVTICNRREYSCGHWPKAPKLGPLCASGNCCYRDDAYPSHERVYVGHIQADLLFINSCGSFRLGPSDIGDGESLVVRFNDGPGAVCISSRYTHESLDHVQMIALAAWQADLPLREILSLIAPPEVPQLYSLIGDLELSRGAAVESFDEMNVGDDGVISFVGLRNAVIHSRILSLLSDQIAYRNSDGSQGTLEFLGRHHEGLSFWAVRPNRQPALGRPPRITSEIASHEVLSRLLNHEPIGDVSDHAAFSQQVAENVQRSYHVKHWPVVVNSVVGTFRLFVHSLRMEGRCFGCKLRTLRRGLGAVDRDLDHRGLRQYAEPLLFDRICPRCFQIGHAEGAIEVSFKVDDAITVGESIRIDVELTRPATGLLWPTVYYSEFAPSPNHIPQMPFPQPKPIENRRHESFDFEGLWLPGIVYVRIYFINRQNLALSVASRQCHVHDREEGDRRPRAPRATAIKEH